MVPGCIFVPEVKKAKAGELEFVQYYGRKQPDQQAPAYDYAALPDNNAWPEGAYIVKANKTISNRIIIDGNVKLFLGRGAA